MKNTFSKLWKNYRHRFVPWMAANITAAGRREVMACTDKVASNETLKKIFLYISSSLDQALQESKNSNNEEVMAKCLGYSVRRARSLLSNAGTGVVLSTGSAERGDFIAFYPGTVYRRFEPLFLPSIGNCFILRCMDGIYIDGNDRLLSKAIYKSCVNRDSWGRYRAADVSWLTKIPLVPWNIGQYVNNGTKEYPSNVAYQEFEITDFPPKLDYLLPNIWFSGSRERHLRAVALIAIRKIEAGDEIFSNYVTFVHDK